MNHMRKYKIHFNWQYFWRADGLMFFSKWANGWAIGPFLFYRPKDLVYYRYVVPREVLNLVSAEDFFSQTRDLLIRNWKRIIPWDFTFVNGWTVYSTRDIRTGFYHYTIEALAAPIMKDNK